MDEEIRDIGGDNLRGQIIAGCHIRKAVSGGGYRDWPGLSTPLQVYDNIFLHDPAITELLVGSEKATGGNVYSDRLKTTRPVKSFVTQAQYAELTEAARRNGWPLAREIRHRLAIATPDRIYAHTEQLRLLQRLDELLIQTWMDNILKASQRLKWGYAFRSGNTERADEIDALKAEFKRLRREVSEFKKQLKDLKGISERTLNAL